MSKQNAARTEYEAAVKDLQKFCEDHTDLTAIIMDGDYPIRVQFIPNTQLTLFGNENIDENGEVNDLTVTVGLSTAVKSTLKFKMDAKLLKKLIKLAETVGSLYYHAFREQEGERRTPLRPVERTSEGSEQNESAGVYACPNCGNTVGLKWAPVTDPIFCPNCGQALDWTPDEEAET